MDAVIKVKLLSGEYYVKMGSFHKTYSLDQCIQYACVFTQDSKTLEIAIKQVHKYYHVISYEIRVFVDL